MYAGIGGSQDVTITSKGKTLWHGSSGQIAEFEIHERTEINVKYSLNLMHYGGNCNGIIDPEMGNKYAVNIRTGAFTTALTLQRIDVIDSE